MATTNSATVSLKLLIDTKSNKVLFAEASKEVVDFLFTLLSLHVATVTRLLLSNGETIDAFEEKVVDLDIEEGLKLVKASLESKTALTNVFLGNKVHEGFNFGPLKKLSFWRFILVCGLTLTILAYIGLFQRWPFDLIGNKYYTARYGKNDLTSPRKPICFPNDPFALSLIQK
ncbi:unnamed protein product [Prunus armeniaca]